MKKFKLLVKKLFVLSLAGGVLSFAGWMLIQFYPNTVTAYQTKEVIVDNLSVKIEEIKSEMIGELMKCESAGHSEEDGIIVFDSNNKASIGQFQWQKASVIHYYKSLYQKDISAKEAVMIALDTGKARQLTEDVIFKTEKGYTNWLNCANKIGMLETLKLIRKLEQ